MGKATRAGDMDGWVDAANRKMGDERGAFIKRTDLPESDWQEYRHAYDRAYRKSREWFRSGAPAPSALARKAVR